MSDVRYEVADRIALITLDRPDRLNAIVPGMGEEIAGAFHTADDDPEVRAVVLTGAGRGFCGGADMALLAGDGLGELTPGYGLAPEIAVQIRKPVVAAVNGAAAGVGFALMLNADVRFVATDAKLTTAFARLGLIAEYGVDWLLPRLVGLPAALDLLFSARVIDGAEALRLGLASRALPADQVLPQARAYAHRLATECSPRSLAAMKRQVYGHGMHGSYEDCLAQARKLVASALRSDDVREGARALVERRTPRFDPLGPAEGR